jgi:hypothetical protein
MTPTSGYDIPAETWSKPRSDGFQRFFKLWFQNSFALSRHEADLTFLSGLTPEESELARELIRRNLRLRQTHLIDGAVLFKDTEAVPLLGALLDAETNASWRLTISGALWKLVGDERFRECVHRMLLSSDSSLKKAHFHQVLWLNDESAIEALFDLLSDSDHFVGDMALLTLNQLEHDETFFVGPDRLPSQPGYFRRRRSEQGFCQELARNLQAKSIGSNTKA